MFLSVIVTSNHTIYVNPSMLLPLRIHHIYIYGFLNKREEIYSYNKGRKLNLVLCIYLLWNGTFVVYLTPIVFHNLNTWLKTCTQILKPTPINVHRGTHTSLHLFVVYAGFKSFYIIILQWVQFNVQWRYNVAVYIVYRAGQGLGPYIQYKDYWQVWIVYLNFDVIIRIRIKSKGQRCL